MSTPTPPNDGGPALNVLWYKMVMACGTVRYHMYVDLTS
jgi:hypothetical protein